MNLAATTQPNDPNLLAAAFAMTTPAAVAPVDPSRSPFISLIQLLTQSSGGASTSLAAVPASIATQAPDTIADAIIRAMLGGTQTPAPSSAPAPVTAVAPSTINALSSDSFASEDAASTDAVPAASSSSEMPLLANPLLNSGAANAAPSLASVAVFARPLLPNPNADPNAPVPNSTPLPPGLDTGNLDNGNTQVDQSSPDIAAVSSAEAVPAQPIASSTRKRKDGDPSAALPAPSAAPLTIMAALIDGSPKAAAKSGDPATASSVSTTSPSTNPVTAAASNSRDASASISSTPVAVPTAPATSGRTAMAFGVNITAKADAQSAAADGSTPAIAQSSYAAQQDFANGEQTPDDARGIPAPKSNSIAKQASTDTAAQQASPAASADASSNSLPPPSINAASAMAIPVATASVPSAPVTPSAGTQSAATANSNATNSVSAAMSAAPPPPAPAASGPPQQMTLRVSPPSGDATTIDVRVAQRAGQMQVTVHTPDPTLQANLRQDLPELVQSLDRAGFNAETFMQRSVTSAIGGSSLGQGSAFNQGSFNQSQTNQGSGGGSLDSRGFGSGSGDSKESRFAGQQFSGQNSSGQNARDRQAERWLEQIEE